MGYYDIAQICLNGHIINDSYQKYSEDNKRFCVECGSKTISQCPKCSSDILGCHWGKYTSLSLSKAPNYCHNCGNPYPWTEEALKATEDLLCLEDTLSSEELEYFHENMNSILVDTPKSKVVATKFRLALGKISAATGSAIRDIIVDIASESAKKIIFPE